MNPIKLSKRQKLDLALALYVTCLMASNYLGLKVTDFYGLVFSVAILTYPLTFIIIDAVRVVHGKKEAVNFVNLGTAMLVLTAALTWISLVAPPAGRFAYEAQYQLIFGISFRIVLAGLVAYWVAHRLDLVVFQAIYEKYKGRFLWLSANVSSVVGEGLDSVIFMLLAFYGVYPNDLLLRAMLSWWFFKVVINAFQTPILYWARSWMAKDG